MISTSCSRPNTAATPLLKSKRKAMYTSISALASSTDQNALLSNVAPATGPT